VDLFREVVRMKPDLMEGHLNLASGLLNIGMTNEAIAEFNIVLEMAPTNEQVRLFIDRLGVPINTQRD
jgi:tetratricopeptide (TPR) repeat protein